MIMANINYSIQLDIINSSIDFYNYINRVLRTIKSNHPNNFDFHLIEQNNEEQQ